MTRQTFIATTGLLLAFVGMAKADTVELPATAKGPADAWICTGDANGRQSSSVEVTLTVDAQGAVLSKSVNWSPPVTDTTIVPATQDMPSLSVDYDHPMAPDRLGSATGVWIGASGGPGPHLKTTAITLQLDQAKIWSAPFDADLGGDGWSSTSRPLAKVGDARRGPLNTDLLGAIEIAQAGKATIRGQKGEPMGQLQYGLAAHEQRVCLVRQAWALAEKAAQHPAKDRACLDSRVVWFERLSSPLPLSSC